MVLCEQFIFTSSKLGGGGYQIISKSSGITNEILKELKEYVYPIGIEPSKFHDSKSMRVLENEIAFIQSKNIGVGQDGRPDTMYSHIIIMSKDNFKKIGNDSRIFNEYYLESRKLGHLTPLSIENKKLNPDFTCVDIIGIIQVQECLKFIFKNKKIAIINEKNQKFIQSILSLLPPSLSLRSFSTQVPKPNIQTKFEIIQTSEQNDYLTKKFTIIDATKSKFTYKENKTVLDICVEHLIEIIDRKKERELKIIHNEFESLPIKDINKKIIFIIGKLVLKSNKTISFERQIVQDILQIIGEMPPETSKKYRKQIREMLSPEEHQKYALEYEINEIIKEYKIENITLDILHSMFGSLKNSNSETRKVMLKEIYKLKSNEFLRDVRQLIININYSIYSTEILEFIIEQEACNSIILDLLINDQELSKVERQSKYDDFVTISSKKNRKLSLELISKPIFNFRDEYESQNFRYILQRFDENIEKIQNHEENQVLKMAEEIFEKIKTSENFKPTSGITEITRSNLRELIKITSKLQEIVIRVIEKTENKDKKNQGNNIQNKLTEFITKHPIPEIKPKHGLFWGVFGIYD